MVDHSRIKTASDLVAILSNQILDYNNYEQGLVKVIGYPGYQHQDCIVKDFFTFSKWIDEYKLYSVIKVEGLELHNDIGRCINKVTPHSVHLFVNQKFGYSFNWHKDDTDVLLYVLKGKKTVYIRDRIVTLHTGQYTVIPKGHLHRVISTKNTWALSLGY